MLAFAAMKWTIIQCATSVVVGCAAYAIAYPDENPKVPLLAALLFGFGSAWLLTKACERMGLKKD